MGNSGELPAPLPEDIIREILHRLPVKSLVRFSSINNSWRKLLLSDQSFVYSHLEHATNNNVNRLTDVLIYSNCYPDYLPTSTISDVETSSSSSRTRRCIIHCIFPRISWSQVAVMELYVCTGKGCFCGTQRCESAGLFLPGRTGGFLI